MKKKIFCQVQYTPDRWRLSAIRRHRFYMHVKKKSTCIHKFPRDQQVQKQDYENNPWRYQTVRVKLLSCYSYFFLQYCCTVYMLPIYISYLTVVCAFNRMENLYRKDISARLLMSRTHDTKTEQWKFTSLLRSVIDELMTQLWKISENFLFLRTL